jgi:uncharacterized membrane protein YkvA (DUF1232 family)
MDQRAPDLPVAEATDLAIAEPYLEEAARPGALAEVRERLPALLDRLGQRNPIVRLAREAYGYATDPAIPARYKVLGIAALLYLINPFDAIPDVLPGVGYVDDAAVIAAFVVAVRQVVGIVRDAAKDVVTHTATQTQATLATRGLAQLALSLWTATLAASIGLVYAGARAVVDGRGPSPLVDPFAIACLVTAMLGIVATIDAARRVRAVYVFLPARQRDRLLHAVVAQVTGWRIAVLAAPVVVLALVVGIRLAVTFL